MRPFQDRPVAGRGVGIERIERGGQPRRPRHQLAHLLAVRVLRIISVVSGKQKERVAQEARLVVILERSEAGERHDLLGAGDARGVGAGGAVVVAEKGEEVLRPGHLDRGRWSGGRRGIRGRRCPARRRGFAGGARFDR